MDNSKMNRVEQFDTFMCAAFPLKVVQSMVQKLLKMGFFTAPASTTHHGNYEGGLFDHSFIVTVKLVDFTNENHLEWENDTSPYTVGMFHDLCKMDNYIKVGDNLNPGYDYNPDQLLRGHGDKSVMLLSQFMPLTMEEIICIRYHMGAFTDAKEWNDYTKAVHAYPNVLWTHQADMFASQVMGV